MDDKSGLLQGRKAICDFLNIGRPTFKNLIQWGLPVRFHEGRWYAHKLTLEVWLERWTNVCSSKISDVEELGEKE